MLNLLADWIRLTGRLLLSSARCLAGSPCARHAGLSFASFALVLLQGIPPLYAADLPQVLTGVNARFEGASLPVVTGNNMVINQFADKATLHWQSFNIGAGGSVEFKQPSSSSVALNRIFDANPTEVNGRLTANGQVYLINQNGIVFGDGAQVNTQSLVASTLEIDDKVYKEIGFVNAINDASGALPAFDSLGRPMGEIRLAPGARLDSANGGRILIFAPTIVNEGTISTPEGQQVLAAVKDKVLIAASDDPNLRGLLVEVSTGGDVTNLGNLVAERGNITLLGMAVNQQGVARATTSVSLNGSVRLLARDMNGTLALSNDLVPRKPKPVRGGEVTLGAGSVTEVVPDTAAGGDGSALLAVDAQAQAQSRIEIGGTRVRLAGQSRLTATGGVIDITAAANPGAPDLTLPGDPDAVEAEVIVESGAVIDASGDDGTVVSVTRNVVEVEARGNELADSPLQREGPIRNETLQVDSRRGTDLLDIDGAVAAIGRSAGERQSAGGSVRIRSEGDFVLDEGARVDVSGGQVRYTEGLVSTSRLLQANGKVVEISNADPNQSYLGLVDNAVTREAGYVEGKDAGSVTIQARGIDLRGELRAGAIAGVNQRQRPAQLTSSTPAFARPFDQVPLKGALALSHYRSGLPELLLGGATAPAPAGSPPLVISAAQLAAWGFGRIGLVNAGPVTVNANLSLPAWSDLSLTGTRVTVAGDVRAPGGTITMNSSNELVGSTTVPDEDLRVQVDGDIDLSGTWVNDNPLLNRSRPTAPIVLDGGRLAIASGSSIEVGAGSRLDVSAGAWRSADGTFTGGRGGSMAFATGSVETNPSYGSRLALGGELRAFGFAGGGSLSIETERLRIVPQPDAGDDSDILLQGGRQFRLVDVSGGASGSGNVQYILEIGAGTFQQGGFSSYALASTRADLGVATGAELRLRTASYLLTGVSPSLVATGAAIGDLAVPVLKPDFERAPASLTLSANEKLANALGTTVGLAIAAGARILADAGSLVSLRSTTSLFVDGAIESRGGVIDLSVGGGPGIFQPAQKIWLGPTSSIDAGGVALIDTLDPLGLRRGEVLDAGSISVRAEQGSLVGAPGARIAVDGASARLDVGFGVPTRRQVAGAAGEITLAAAESLLFQGGLTGSAPAGSGVPGGRLTVVIDPSRRGVPSLVGVDGIPRGPHTLVVGDFTGPLPDAGGAVDAAYYSTGFVPLTALRAGGFTSLDLVARSSAAGTNDAGAPVPDTPQSLPVVEFRDDLDLRLGRSIRVDAAVLKTDQAQVTLAAPYVGIGYGDARVALDGSVPDKSGADDPQDTATPIRLTPTAGEGLLRVAGELVELVGETVTQGFGDATAGRDGVLIEATGDLRLRGVRTALQSDYAGLFRTAGNFAASAQRIYPTTLTAFELGVEGSGGRITLGGGSAGTPLSVGGALTLHAADIVQGGALFAPLGNLDFVATSSLTFAPGSLTSTSAAGMSAPFFRTEPGGALVIPAPGVGEDQLVFVESISNPEFERQLPEKRIRLTAPAVDLQPGSLFDVRGGSEVSATEFVPGPGGSRDILLADLDAGAAVDPNESFAILPGISAYAPYDPLETPAAESAQGLRIGDTLVLADGLPGLPAGEYAILPARYALFGGFLVTPERGFQDLAPGQGLQRVDGAPILAGRFGIAGSDVAAARSEGFAIEAGSRVRQRAEYLQTPLDALYDAGTIRAPRDAGTLVVSAGSRLDLRGELVRGASGNGLGSAVDIATTASLSVVNTLSGLGGIELLARDLVNLGADSLLLGGTRSALAGGAIGLDASSDLVTIEAGVDIDQRELLLAGGRIVVDGATQSATRLVSSGAPAGTVTRIEIADDAAVLAVSDRALELVRSPASAAGTSAISVADNVAVEARGGLVLDAAGDVVVGGAFSAGDGVLSLGAARLSLGETGGQGITSGLVLSNADLATLAGSDLRLRSRDFVDVYGAIADPLTGTPISFRRLAIDAAGINGRANDGRSSVLSADSIAIGNPGTTPADTAPAAPAAGSSLELRSTGDIGLGAGAFAIRGFADTRLVAGSRVVFTGDGQFDVGDTLDIVAPLLTAGGTTDSVVRAGGHLGVNASGEVPAAGAGLGAGLLITAGDIDFNGRVVLPSGSVRLLQAGGPTAAGGVRIGTDAVIDMSGADLVFGPKQLGTPGGSITVGAATGDVEIAAGALLDVSGATSGGEAGGLQLQAPLGTVTLAEGVRFHGGDKAGEGGRFMLDAAMLAGNGTMQGSALDTLVAALEAGGFRESRVLRLRAGDLVLDADSVMTARDIRLTADSGRIDVAGRMDATGAQGGRIWLAAGDGLAVSGTIDARATAAGGRGGRVDLYALDADGDDADGSVGDGVSLAAGSRIDVSGGSGGDGGSVFLHARRIDSDGDGQTERIITGPLDGEVSGAARAQLVATRVLRDPDAVAVPDPAGGGPLTRVTVTGGLIEAWRAEAAAFIAGLAAPAAGRLQVAAGLQVESSGDLVLQDRWNFLEGWYFGEDLGDPTAPQLGVNGVLTLRAARNIDVQADLTDAFAEQLLFGFLPFDGVLGAVPWLDAGGAPAGQLVRPSWGYRLASGADLAGADVLATAPQAGQLQLADGARIRTGTADIDIAASGDVRLGDGAAIYAAGWDRGLSSDLQAVLSPLLGAQGLTAYDLFGTWLNGGQFADGGGTVTLVSGGHLVADTAPGPVTEWLTRVGSGEITATTLYSATEGYGAIPTHWGVVFGQFRNGVAAFGGGDLRVTVGGGVRKAALAVPTTGRVRDGVVLDDSTPGRLLFAPSVRNTETLGGGRLTLRTGDALVDGQIVLGRGSADLRTGGDGASPSTARLYAGGDASIDWLARGGLQLAGLQDPTFTPVSASQLGLMSQIFSTIESPDDFDNRFFTYTDGSRVQLGALGGDVSLDGPEFGGLLPPTLSAVAFSGDINLVATPLDFYPAATATLALLARGNVTGNFVGSTETRLRQSDADPGLLPSVDRPDLFSISSTPAPVPVHTGDTVPNLIIARDGSIQSRPGNPGYWSLELAKPAVFSAGTDIDNVSVRVQHIATDARSSFQAGRDIAQGELRDNTGRFATNDRRIFEIWGPGSAEFFAYRDISLGTSAGIESIGNTRNPALAADGAALALLAGTGGEPAYERFIDTYLSSEASAYRDDVNALLAQVDAGRGGYPSSSDKRSLLIAAGEYAEELQQFLEDFGVAVVGEDPVAAFRSLGRSLQRMFVTDVLFAELKSWGTAAETPDRADRLNYLRGYTALDTLFELTDPLGKRADAFAPGVVQQAVQGFLGITDAQAANSAQVALFGKLFPQGDLVGGISLLLSQVQTLAGGALSMLAPGGDINAGAADADIIDKAPQDLGIVTARGGGIDIAVDNDLLVNSTRVFALQGDLLVWSSNGNIDAGKGAKTVTSVPDPITRIDPNTGNTIIEFPPAVSGSGLQGENAQLFAPRGAVNAGDAGIRTSGDLTIGAVEIVGADNIDVGGVEIGFSTADVAAVAPPGAASASSAATKGVDSQAAMLSDENELGERTVLGTEVTFISVEVLSFGDGECAPGEEECD